MSSFIRLSSRIINSSHIVEILKTPNKYFIIMTNTNVDGFLFMSTGGFGSTPNRIEICCTKNRLDYDVITKFIQQIP